MGNFNTNNSKWDTDTVDLNKGGQLDAGNRLRVSQITTLIDIKQINDNAPLFWDRENIGTASQTFGLELGGSKMAVAANNDAAICQSKMFAPYYSGKGQFMEITFSGMTSETGVTKRAGYFSSNTTTPFDSSKDGFWLENNGEEYFLVIEKNGSRTLNVCREEWDNSAPDIDLTKFNVLVCQFLYLGGTALKFGFVFNGVINWVHTYAHAGVKPNTFIRSPMQPIRYEIRSTGGAGSFDQICAQVASEGSIDEIGVQRGFDLDGALINANAITVWYALIGIKLKSAYRNIRVEEEVLSVLAKTNDSFVWQLRLNSTVAGTFNFADQTNSSIQLALGDSSGNPSTNTVTGGTVLSSGNGAGNSGITEILKSAIRLGSTIDGTIDELVLCVKPLSVNLDITASLNVKEFV